MQEGSLCIEVQAGAAVECYRGAEQSSVPCRSVSALGLHPCITALLQLAGMYALGILVVLCAYAGFSVTASILEVQPACFELA